MKNYFKYYRLLVPLRKIEALVLSLNIVTAGLGLVNPYLTKLLIDNAYADRSIKMFVFLIAAGAGAFLFNGLIESVSNYLNNYVRFKVNFNLGLEVFKKLQKLPYGFFQNSSTGENLYKLNYDVEQVSRFTTDTLSQAVLLLPKTLFIFLIIIYLDWRMSLLALVLAPLAFIGPYFFTEASKRALKGWIELSQSIFKQLQESLSHIHLIKAYGRQAHHRNLFAESSIKKLRLSLKKAKIDSGQALSASLANRVIVGLITIYGGYQLIKGRMTLGTLGAIILYLNQLFGLQGQLIGLFHQVIFAQASCERIDFILSSPCEALEEKGAIDSEFSGGAIEFERVNFSFKEKEILKEMSFSIKGGSCVALVGPSGSGKTTLVNLILRLYALDSGRILIDARDIRRIRAASLYPQIGVVLQEPYLWNDTIGNNIKYGKRDVGKNEIMEAARIACIDGFINGLPAGLDSIIGEGACKISEGQKQRIAIARALVRRPRILILDEALSSIDAKIESMIIDNIRDYLKGATFIIISHRLSAIKKSELVYFLQDKNQIHIACHEELFDSNPKYQDYLASQPNLPEKTADFC